MPSSSGNILSGDGRILPPKQHEDEDCRRWSPPQISGSFYQTLLRLTQDRIRHRGDWNWLNDEVTGEVMTAREAFDQGKRLEILIEPPPAKSLGQ